MKIRLLLESLISTRDLDRLQRETERTLRETEPRRLAVERDAERAIRWHKTLARWWQEWSRRKKQELFESWQRRREVNRANASKPRGERGPAPQTVLIGRGLARLLAEQPGVTAGELCDVLEADGRINYDDADLELRLSGDCVVIRDLAHDAPLEEARIKRSSLRAYLMAARKT